MGIFFKLYLEFSLDQRYTFDIKCPESWVYENVSAVSFLAM